MSERMGGIDRYYEILELESGASPEEVKRAYRDLVKVWHPDRFSNDPRLQQKAQEKLKEINDAYERLQSVQPDPRRRTLQPESRSQRPDLRPERGDGRSGGRSEAPLGPEMTDRGDRQRWQPTTWAAGEHHHILVQELEEAERRGAKALLSAIGGEPGIDRVIAEAGGSGVVIHLEADMWSRLSKEQKQALVDRFMRIVLQGNGNIAVPIKVVTRGHCVTLSFNNPMRMVLIP